MATQKIQKFVPFDNTTVANYKSWAQSFGSAISTLGWALAGDTGQVNWTNVVTAPTNQTSWPSQFNWKAAFSPGTIYAVGDIVTSSGLTFLCQIAITAETLTSAAVSGATTTYNGSSMHISVGDTVVIAGFVNAGNNGTFTVNTVTGAWGSATAFTVTTSTQIAETHAATVINGTAPANNVSLNGSNSQLHHWATYNYEIWKSNGPLSANHPIYLKLIYHAGQNAGLNSPALFFQIGTTHTNGIIGGNLYNSGTVLGFSVGSGASLGSVPLENDFCGNADKLTMAPFLGAQQIKGGSTTGILCIDRAHDSSGGDLDAYVAVLTVAQNTSSSSIAPGAQLLYKPGSGTVIPAAPGIWPIVNTASSSNSFNGQTPALPVFFCPGYLANPCLGAIAMGFADIPPTGSLFNVFMYGTSHTYMSVKQSGLTGPTPNTHGAIQWE